MNRDFVTVINKLVALRNRWMVEMIREKWDGRIVLSTDNPSAGSMSGDELVADINNAFSLVIERENVVLMEHSCGGNIPDVSFAIDAGLNALHLDAFGQPQTIEANYKSLASFLEEHSDRFLALGIVPTKYFKSFAEELLYGEPIVEGKLYEVAGAQRLGSQLRITDDAKAVKVIAENYQKALEFLYSRLSGIVDKIHETRIFTADKQTLWSRIMVSSSCGQGTLTEGVGETVFCLMRDLSYLVRERQDFVDYGTKISA